MFVSASSSETQGLTYLEALAAGTPAVCRADPCLNGVIENGVNGWQYETGRERDEELNRLLTDEPLRKRLARGAAAGAAAFSEEAFGEKVLALYEARRAAKARRGGAV